MKEKREKKAIIAYSHATSLIDLQNLFIQAV